MASTKTAIVDVLNNLLEGEFKEFKWHLSNKETLENSIPRGKLEKADRQDVVDFMEQHFGTSDAGKVAIRVLRSMNQNNFAGQLKKTLTEVSKDVDSGSSSSRGTPPTAPSPPAGVVVNFNSSGGSIQAPVIHGSVINGSMTFK
ncbi:caspase b isoform X2 [Danio aesculapii]|uniref:caspase b isoform X2 n=1 Tax=Danio aesculapii TaxID=1142201 RepID=UPI0024C04238|nr:caspase b isoform X2 [Danio aesculapii]